MRRIKLYESFIGKFDPNNVVEFMFDIPEKYLKMSTLGLKYLVI
jgi:hypothetical protein